MISAFSFFEKYLIYRLLNFSTLDRYEMVSNYSNLPSLNTSDLEHNNINFGWFAFTDVVNCLCIVLAHFFFYWSVFSYWVIFLLICKESLNISHTICPSYRLANIFTLSQPYRIFSSMKNFKCHVYQSFPHALYFSLWKIIFYSKFIKISLYFLLKFFHIESLDYLELFLIMHRRRFWFSVFILIVLTPFID